MSIVDSKQYKENNMEDIDKIDDAALSAATP